MTVGIYQIRNIKTGKRYIGSSCHIEERWQAHFSELNHGKHCNKYLQRAWNKYGKNSFQFEIIEECPIGLEKKFEQRYLDEQKPEYNASSCACGFEKGHTLSASHIAKLKNQSSPFKNRHHTSEAIAKIRLARAIQISPMKGKKLTIEQRKKMSIIQKNKPSYGMKGKFQSVEAKIRMSIAKKGKSYRKGTHHTSETKAKISAALKGRKFTPEHRAKMSAARKGRPSWNKGEIGHKHTPETKAKISAALKKIRMQQCRVD